MEEMKKCLLFRNGENLNIPKGFGYCGIDKINTICEGNIHLCDKQEELRQHLLKKWVEEFI